MKILIKCADLSNELRPSEIAGVWLDCLLAEYFKQVQWAWPTAYSRCVVLTHVYYLGRCREGTRITSWTGHGS